MSRIHSSLLLLAALVTLAWAGAGIQYAGSAGSGQAVATPEDVAYIDLFDNFRNSHDTLAIGDTSNIYGPYQLCRGNGSPMYAGFQVYASKQTLATDSVRVSYQLVPGLLITDTISSWTACDTFYAAGDVGGYFSLASQAAAGIVFKVTNQGPSIAAIIDKRVRVMFKRSGTWMIEKR